MIDRPIDEDDLWANHLEEQGTATVSESTKTVDYAAQCPDYMIVYEDAEVGPEMFTCEDAARDRLKQASDRWNCHLFQRIATA